MFSDITVIRYKRRLTLSAENNLFPPLIAEQKIEAFLKKNGREKHHVLNQIPLFEAYGYYEPLLNRVRHQNAIGVLWQHVAREDARMADKECHARYKTLNSVRVSDDQSVVRYPHVLDSMMDRLVKFGSSRNVEQGEEYSGQSDPQLYNAYSFFSIDTPNELLQYLNNFYKECCIPISFGFEINSFQLLVSDVNLAETQLEASIIYTFCGICYKMIITQRYFKSDYRPISSYIEYNNMIQVAIDMVLDYEIFGRFVYAFHNKDKGHSRHVSSNRVSGTNSIDNNNDNINRLKDFQFFCPICLSDTVSSDSVPVKILKCGHIMCENCLKEWLTVKPKCPYCTANLVKYQKFPKYIYFRGLFMSKYWKIKVLLRNISLFRFIGNFVDSLRFRFQTDSQSVVLNLLMYMINDIRSKHFSAPQTLAKAFDKSQIAIDENLDLSDNAARSLKEKVLGYLAVYTGLEMKCYADEFDFLLFLGDYIFKNELLKYEYGPIANPEETDNNIDANGDIGTSSNIGDSATSGTMAGEEPDTNDSGSGISIMGMVKKFMLTTLPKLNSGPGFYETYFKLYSKQYNQLYNQWIHTTVRPELQAVYFQRVSLCIPVICQNNSLKYNTLLEKLVTEINKKYYKKDFVKIATKQLLAQNYSKRQIKLNASLQFAVAKKSKSQAIAFNNTQNVIDPIEADVIKVILTISDLADIFVAFSQICIYNAVTWYHENNIGDILGELMDTLFDTQAWNDILYASRSPLSIDVKRVAIYLFFPMIVAKLAALSLKFAGGQYISLIVPLLWVLLLWNVEFTPDRS